MDQNSALMIILDCLIKPKHDEESNNVELYAV